MTIRNHDELELMSLRRLSDSLEATRSMLQQAQNLAKDAQGALLGLASEFCAPEMLKRQEKNEDLSLVAPQELVGLLRSRFKALKLAGITAGAAQLPETNRVNAELRSELEAQRSRADRAQERVELLEKQVAALEMTLAHYRQKQSQIQPEVRQEIPAENPDEFQQWYTAWQREHRSWERDSSLIPLIGGSGLSLSTELEAAIAHATQLSARTIRRALKECRESGLLERETTVSIEGRPPQIYTLTEKGRWLYRQMTGAQPRAPEREELLKAHKSERHLALILKTAAEFQRLGFTIERQPAQIQLEANRFFMPDLVARKDGETCYLEVETGAKDKPSLEQKWENALAGGGRICVATDNRNTLRRIQGGIAQWSRFEGRSLTLHITCLATLKAKMPGESPWYAVKNYAPGE